jgi:hypothetical protein
MNENNEFDYTVAKKVEGKYRLSRILMVFFYVIFGMSYFVGLAIAHLYPIMAFTPLLVWILVFFTWRFVSIEYRYETVSGGIKFYTVYGGKKKKLVLDMRIKDFEEITPFDADAKTRLSSVRFDRSYSFSRSENDDTDKYFATFKDNDGKACIVYFDATEQSLKIMKFYNSDTTVAKTGY